MLDFAHKGNERSHEVGDEGHEALARHGFDAEDAWDIASITAFFGLSNRVASTTGLMPNPQTGTVHHEVNKSVQDIKGGKITFRVDKQATCTS